MAPYPNQYKTVDYLKDLRQEFYNLRQLGQQAFLSFVNSNQSYLFYKWRDAIEDDIASINMAIQYHSNVVEMFGEPPNTTIIKEYFKRVNYLKQLPIAKMAKLAIKRSLGMTNYMPQNFMDLTEDFHTPQQRSILSSFTNAQGQKITYANPVDTYVSDIDDDDFNF